MPNEEGRNWLPWSTCKASKEFVAKAKGKSKSSESCGEGSGLFSDRSDVRFTAGLVACGEVPDDSRLYVKDFARN
jgi:hypothetical protein